ncbi:putative transcriptional regulator [Janibacter sp. HTCC2649]|nr:putative transcriptional regulator [Janibacter sp. HTCC2649]
MSTTATATFAGILRPEQLAEFVQVRRWPASARVSHWVENHWSLRWDLPEGASFASEVLPHPTCSLTVERGDHPRPEAAGEEVVVTGVVTRRFDVEIRGSGRVAGLRFRPGGLAALSGLSARAWTDRTVAARDVVPSGVVTALAGLDVEGDDGALEAGMSAVEEAFPAAPVGGDARYDRVLRVVADMLEDRSILAVADLEERHGVSARTLQRDFLHYVGVGPKWVLGRYRMHDVVAALDGGYDGSLTDLALRHGWYDQAHFTRDFTALVGVPPSRYRGQK